MFKMIIADDEALVREGLKEIPLWEEYAIEVIAEAANGQKAYELCLKHKPDILFTDIRMPFMDGLEVATKLKEDGLDIKIILYSGIQDFSYAQTALNVSVEAYILKPLKKDELREALQKVTERILKERDHELRFQRLKQLLRENIGVAREKFLRNLVLGLYKKEIEILQKLEYFSLPFNMNEPITVAVMEIDDYSSVTEKMSEESKQLLCFSITNIADELIGNYSSGISFFKDENEVIILCKRQGLAEEQDNKLFLEISSCLKEYLQITVSIGIGYIAYNMLDIHSSYSSAATALQYKFYTGKDSINYISDIATDHKESSQTDLYDLQMRLMSAMKLGNIGGVEKMVKEILDQLATDKKNHIEQIQGICSEIIFISSRGLYEMGERLEEIVGPRSTILEEIYRAESIYDLKDVMSVIFNKIAQYNAQKYTQKNKKVITEIKAIIEKNYMYNISVNRISEMIHLTPNYISLIFKQETNETITDYVTKVRVEKAMELLKSSDLKVLDVSEMVGYEDPSYFSRVFKKHTGVFPQRYRSLTVSNDNRE